MKLCAPSYFGNYITMRVCAGTSELVCFHPHGLTDPWKYWPGGPSGGKQVDEMEENP